MYQQLCLLILLCMYVYVCYPLHENFDSTQVQVEKDFQIGKYVRHVVQDQVDYIIVVPHIERNQLTVFKKQLNRTFPGDDKVLILSVDTNDSRIVSKTKDFLSRIHPDDIDIQNQPIVLKRQKGKVGKKYLFRESTEMDKAKINKIFKKFNK